jgi:hypothetical protein
VPLFTLPAHPNAGYLIIAQHADRASHGNVHFPEEVHDLFRRDTELTRQVVHAQLAQPIPLNAVDELIS